MSRISQVTGLAANPASYSNEMSQNLTPVQSIKSERKILMHQRLKRCLIIKKRDNEAASNALAQVAEYLEFRGIVPLVEAVVAHSEFPRLRPWSSDDSLEHPDFCICLGGDGTLLHLNSLFQTGDSGVPPVLSFAGGSLGFLTPLKINEFKKHIDALLRSHIKPVRVTPRMRLHCSIVRYQSARICEVYQPLNELVVNRTGSVCELQLEIDDHPVTQVTADGIILSTPTGSTAYNMSAGGPMVAPNVPCITMCPVCPHSLSLRPIVLSDSAMIRLVVPLLSKQGKAEDLKRCVAHAAFDGREQIELFPGDAICITASPFSFPSVKVQEEQVDWLESIQTKLHWNENTTRHPLHAAITSKL